MSSQIHSTHKNHFLNILLFDAIHINSINPMLLLITTLCYY